MARVRFTATAVHMIVLALLASLSAMPDFGPRLVAAEGSAAATWPVSSGLVVAEIVTGGVSASDEYVELANASGSPLDLVGLEVAYVTASGATITRKATWATSLVLEPGRHLLIANGLGVHAGIADATYSGGLAATGGAIVLRPVGGTPVDAVGWGDAANAFVEGVAAPAPPPSSSIERRPGGGDNGADTNDNAADFVVDASPVPQNLAANPGPTPTPEPTATPTPEPEPTATLTPAPTPTPTPSATPEPTATPSPTPTATPEPTATPSPTPTPTVEPTPEPTASPSPAPVLTIQAARELPDGTHATVEGVLTTALGSLEDDRGAFMQDASAGIALYLDAALQVPIVEGTRIRAAGVLDSRYAQRTLRVGAGDVVDLGGGTLPDVLAVSTGAAAEPVEGLRLELEGVVTEAPVDLSDGLGLLVDDGSGAVRVIVGPDALGVQSPATGDLVTARGPLGQRDSGGSGLAGYRLHATLPGELRVSAPPGPSPSPTPSPTATPTPTPTPPPSPSPSASPSPSPSVSPTPIPTATPGTTVPDVATARGVPVGGNVTVRGVVIAEAGRLGSPPLIAIGDATGGLPVRLPDDARRPTRGTLLEVTGTIASPYGQTELRAVSGGLVIAGSSSPPAATAIDAGGAGEAVEGRLVTVHGTISVSAARATSGDLALTIEGEDGATLRAYADSSAGLEATSLRKGAAGTFTGILGQRASRRGALDGYRIWLRDAADLALVAPAPGSPTPTPAGSDTPAASSVLPIARALARQGARVTVEGVLTVDRDLFDGSGRRTVVQDATGAVEVYLAAPDEALRAGRRVRVHGTMAQAYGAPRLRAETVRVLGSGRVTARDLRRSPGVADEWELVRVAGTITDVRRLGDRWLAELSLGAATVPVSGLSGAGIAASGVVEGRRAIVTGIVRRPYPTATDRRFAIVPRGKADLALGAAPAGSTAGPGGSPGASGAPGPVADPAGSAPDVDIVRLADHVGQPVRVGGVVTALERDGVRLDDGTGVGRIVLEGGAAELVALLEPGDALNATGSVEHRGDEIAVVVTDPAALVLVGDLGDGLDEPGGPAPAGDGADAPGTGAPDALRADLGLGLALEPAPAGIGTLLIVSAMSLLVTAARRHRGRRLLQARVLARLEALATPRSGGRSERPEPPG